RQASSAQISGAVGALGVSDPNLRLSVKGQDKGAPSLDAIVDELAHEILRRYLAREISNKLEAFEPSEFKTLSDVLVKVAQANRKTLAGRPAQKEFAELIPPITDLADRVPSWPELVYLAAKIADSGKDTRVALNYYRLAQRSLR